MQWRNSPLAESVVIHFTRSRCSRCSANRPAAAQPKQQPGAKLFANEPQCSASVVTARALLPTPGSKLLAHYIALDAWRRNLLILYLSMVIGALVAGQLRSRVER
jgi:hypothetical protein